MADIGEGLLQAIKTSPDDWPRYLVYADWCEEQSLLALAHAYRWMAQRQRRPAELPTKKRWRWAWYKRSKTWHRAFAAEKRKHSHALLPPLVFECAKPNYSIGKHTFQSWDDAVVSLASRLERLWEAYMPSTASS